jgi:hypothetical protein
MLALRGVAVVVALAGCETTSRDELAGTWRAGTTEVHLYADGRYDGPLTVDRACDDDQAVVDACKARQRWDRRGDHVRFFPAFVVSNRNRSAGGGFLGLFNTSRRDAPPCECKVQSEPEVFELRDPDTIAQGKEVAVRVK